MPEHVARGVVETPLGTLRIAATERGVVRVALPREAGRGFGAFLARAFPDAEPVDWLPWIDKASAEITEYFAGKRTEWSVALDLRGTPFQLRVWRALCEIEFGETRSYAELARTIRSPLAVRAVGAANGANPVPLIVPCHRVIASDGGLGGYGGGLEAKRRLLAFEHARLPRGALL